MARKRGNFNVANNYEVIAKAPLDAKQLVKTYNELISPVTWKDSSGDVWLYNGAIVSVGEDPDPLKNGIYVLNNVSLYTAPSSWTKQGAFTGSTSMGENGLYGTTGIIKLGGYLTENTVLDGNDTYSFKMLNMDSIELSNINDISNININNGGIIFSHSGQTVNYNSISGLTYGGDYSMYYGNRSLVDKEYVDVNVNNLSISSVTKTEYNQYTGATQSVLNELNYVANLSITGLTNGITKIGNHDGKLGGILTENTIISLSNNNMIITGGTGSSSSVILDNFKFVDGNQGINKILESDIDGNAKWVEAIEINILTGTTNGVKTVNGNVELGGIITKPIIFTDNRTTKVGLQYAADYSNNYTDRTLVDKEYIDNLLTGYTTTITANNGLIYTNDNIRLGGDLTGNTIINIDNHELTITGTTGSSSSVVLNKLRFVDGNQGENNVMQSDIDGNVKWVESIEVDLITGATNGVRILDEKVQLGGTISNPVVFIDERVAKRGLEYGSDYSSGFTSHSLVDKNYVDNNDAFKIKVYTIDFMNFSLNATDINMYGDGTITAIATNNIDTIKLTYSGGVQVPINPVGVNISIEAGETLFWEITRTIENEPAALGIKLELL